WWGTAMMLLTMVAVAVAAYIWLNRIDTSHQSVNQISASGEQSPADYLAPTYLRIDDDYRNEVRESLEDAPSSAHEHGVQSLVDVVCRYCATVSPVARGVDAASRMCPSCGRVLPPAS